MRIAHVTDFYLPRLGGIEMHVADLTARQRAAGHDADVLTSTPGPEEEHVLRLTNRFKRPHALHPLATRAGIGVVRRGGYDLVHAHLGVGSPLGFFVARAAASAGIPTMVTVHSLWEKVRPIMAGLDAVGSWSGLPIVWSAVSEAAASPVRPLLPGHTVHVIPNGIEQDQWRLPPAPERSGELVVAAVMRLAARKRPLAALRILRQAQELLGEEVRLRLEVAGDGPRQRAMESYLRRHHLTETVTLHGRLPREDVHALLGSAHVFLAPADLESFGIAALEARCTGLPVIAKASGGVREFVRHEREGLLCRGDHEMAQALVRLARDAGLRHRIARHNRASESPVNWTRVLQRTDAAYAAAQRLQAARLRAEPVRVADWQPS